MTLTLAGVLAGRVPDGVHGWTGEVAPHVLADAAHDAGWELAHLRGPRDKGAVLDEVRRAFSLPGWTGRNWDALAEALGDLAPGRWLLVWDDPVRLPEPDRETLTELLTDAARDWASRAGRFVVLLRSTD